MKEIRLDRFEQLADRLEAQPKRFRFLFWVGKGYGPNHCGSTGCSLGLAVEMFGKECGVHFDEHERPRTAVGGDTAFPSAVAIFGDISLGDFERMFLPGDVLDEFCTAAEAAAEIRKYVAEKRAEVTT